MRPLTVERLAEEKKLPAAFLRAEGLFDDQRDVGIPYRTFGDEQVAVKYRTALKANEGSYWPKGTPLMPYGVDRLQFSEEIEYLILVEGESDCWTLWYHRFPALGLPGSSTVGCLQIQHVKPFQRLYLFREPDTGGGIFVEGLTKQLAKIGNRGGVKEINLGPWIKDPSQLHIECEAGFVNEMKQILVGGKPISLSVHVGVSGSEQSGSRNGEPLPGRQSSSRNGEPLSGGQSGSRNGEPLVEGHSGRTLGRTAVAVTMADVAERGVEWLSYPT